MTQNANQKHTKELSTMNHLVIWMKGRPKKPVSVKCSWIHPSLVPKHYQPSMDLMGLCYAKKDKAYNWRKEMDDYEKRTEFDRDVRARNVSALHRNDPEEDHWAVTQRKSEDRKRTSRDTIERPIEKAAKKEQESEVVKSWREKRDAERATEQISEPEPGKQSWREKLAEKNKQEEVEKKQKEADAVATAATVAEAKQRALAAAADATADSSTKSAEPTADGEKTAEEG